MEKVFRNKGDKMIQLIRELYRYKYLIEELVTRDIKKKYRRSVLGVLWSILNPLLMMTVTAMVFSTLFRFDIANYPLYLLTGQILFAFYAESTKIQHDNCHFVRK